MNADTVFAKHKIDFFDLKFAFMRSLRLKHSVMEIGEQVIAEDLLRRESDANPVSPGVAIFKRVFLINCFLSHLKSHHTIEMSFGIVGFNSLISWCYGLGMNKIILLQTASKLLCASLCIALLTLGLTSSRNCPNENMNIKSSFLIGELINSHFNFLP